MVMGESETHVGDGNRRGDVAAVIVPCFSGMPALRFVPSASTYSLTYPSTPSIANTGVSANPVEQRLARTTLFMP